MSSEDMPGAGKPDPNPGGRFEFRECRKIIRATGKKAGNLAELMEGIRTASEGSIYHHTQEYFFKGHIIEYTNDFAEWAGRALEERVLSENLSNIDPFRHKSVESLRGELLNSIAAYREKFGSPRRVLPGEEFHFQESVTIVFPAGFRALNLAEFLMAMRFVGSQSIYYHFYEGRRRLEGMDDFSKWIEKAMGLPALAAKIRAIDPFMHSIEGVRDQIVKFVEEALREEIEVSSI
ncbi:MAG: DUF5752 family protein [Nitrospiraceae bacterium]|nr:DUF5752 family protein [Nitrospiraceae bacterium]